jgi:TolB-like protein/tetratricopeptide (TPR) repeat protein
LPNQDPEQLKRFLAQARALCGLSHPHIAALFELGEQQGQIFLVYEYVPGENLHVQMAGRPLNVRRALDLTAQIGDALAEAHAVELLHRDITPENIIVTPKGHAKLLDFGLAAWMESNRARDTEGRLLARGTALGFGTVAYMAPEQVLGLRVDGRADLFALGAVLYEMLTGKTPFAGASPSDIATEVVHANPPAPSSVNPSVPHEIDGVLAKALSKDIESRYQSAAIMAAELRRIAAALQAGNTHREEVRPTIARWPRARLALLSGLLFAAIAVSGWVWLDSVRHTWRRWFGPQPVPRLLVMPLTGGESQGRQYFGDGLAEDVITRLGQIPGVQVLGRSSIRAYRGRDVRQIARDLNAAVALIGSIEPRTEEWDRLKVTWSLVDPQTDTQLWRGEYERSVRDVFTLQMEVTEQVARELRVPLKPSSARDRTALRLVDSAAYDFYLQGRQAVAARDFRTAIDLYERSMATDASLIEAEASLAQALYLDAVTSGQMGSPQILARIREAAEDALTADPDLPQAHLAMGLASPTVPDALGHFRKALSVDPSYSEVYQQIGNLIRDFDPPHAIRFYRKALDVDPGQAINYSDIASANLLLNLFEEAQRELAKGQALSPGRSWWTAMRARIQLDQRHYDVAAAMMDNDPETRQLPGASLVHAGALRLSGRRPEALSRVVDVARQFPDFCEARAMLAGLRLEAGDRAEAQRLANTVFDEAQNSGAPVVFLCAAMAAAAIDDAERTGMWLRRIATDQEALRYWTLQVGAVSANALFRRRLYPWSNVIDRPAVNQARGELDVAFTRMRAEAARLLQGLPEVNAPEPTNR